jgi:hypothetical protein
MRKQIERFRPSNAPRAIVGLKIVARWKLCGMRPASFTPPFQSMPPLRN